MIKKYVLFFSFLLFVSSFLAQTGPGGVGTTDGTSKLDLWLNASVGVQDASSVSVADGADVTFWRDQSGNNVHAQQLTLLDKPSYSATGLGGQPTIKFTQADTEVLSAMYTFKEDLHAFVVGSSTPTTWSSYGLFGSARGSNGLIFHTDFNRRSFKYYSISSTGDYFFLGEVTPPDITVPNIYALSVDHTTGRVAYDFGFNGSSRTGRVVETRTSTTESVFFGKDDLGNDRYLDGTIGEVIYYKEKLNTAENIIVSNYLSAKYNIVLSSNDFYNEDTTGENFDYKVAGIGQATDGTNHTDSQGTGIIRISTPTSLGNDEFLFWGEDVKEANYKFSSSSLTNYIERIDTKWRVSKRNDLGTVTVRINASDVTFNSPEGCNQLQLVVDNNNNFSSPEGTFPFTLSGGSSGVYTATGVNFSDNDYFTLQYTDQIVLNGTIAYNGSGGSNKPNTSDDCYRLLVKTNSLTLSEDADVREIEVEAGGVLAVDSGIRLQVTNGIKNSGDIRLVGTSQLVQTHTTTTNLNTGTGSLYVDQRASTSTKYQSGYWSSPVRNSGTAVGTAYSIANVLKDGSVATAATATAGEASAISFIGGHDGSSTSLPIEISTRWLATFNNALDWTRFVSPTASVLTPGLGWNMKSVGSRFTFKGIPNDGEYSFPISQNNYSLLGNPYPSALDTEAFITQNASQFNGTLYIYDSSTDNTHIRGGYTGVYNTIVSGVAISGGRYLPIGQGFFVTKDTPGSGVLTFRNSQRTLTALGNTGDFFAKTAKEKSTKKSKSLPILKIGFKFDLNATEKRTRKVAIAFRGLTNNYERGFDAEMWGLQPTDMYLKVNDKESPFIITGVQDFDTSISLPLVVQLDEQRDVTFSVEEQQNIESSVYLFDRFLNVIYDLSKESRVLNLEQGIYSDRFFIVFSKEVLATEDVESTSLKIFQKDNKEIVIKNTSALFIKKIRLYNLLGEEVVNQKTKTNKSTISIDVSKLATSIYLVSLETDKGIIKKKIILD